jgi:hypothetical protein
MPDETSNAELQGYLEAIDRADDELATLRGEYMQSCKGPQSAIKEIKGSARENGTNMKAFNTLLKGHREQRKQENRIAQLEVEDAEAYERMVEQLGAFGDTPLGAAALDAARPRGRRREDGLDDLKA